MSSSSKDGMLALHGTFIGLCAFAVGLRLYARQRQSQRVLADDWFAVFALSTFIGAAICVFIAVHDKSLGYSSSNEADPSLALAFQTPASYQLQVALDVFQTTTLAFTKLSALFFYRRVFVVKGPSQWFNVATACSIVVVVLWLLVFDFLPGFQCGTHFSALWDGTYLQYCVLSFPYLYGLAISDVLLDVWILVLPIPQILKLHAPTTKKLSIIGIFLLAFVGLAASIARMAQFIIVEEGGKQYFLHHDEEHADTTTDFFTSLEAGMSLVAVNLPSLWILIMGIDGKKMLDSMRSMTSLRSRSSREDVSKNTELPPSKVTSGRKSSSVSQPPLPTLPNDLENQQSQTSVTHIARDEKDEEPGTKSIRVEVSRD